jgi:hypothetical protein
VAPPPQPEPVEVELLPSGATLPASGSASVSSSTVGGGRSPRGVFVPLVVGVVALGVGWVLGRGGAESSDGAAGATATSTAVDPVDSIAPAPPVPTVVTSESAAPPTTTVAPSADVAAGPAIVETDVEVPPELRGQPIEIVAYGNGRQVFQLDLRTARLRSQQIAAQPFGRARVLVGPTWTLFPSHDPELSSTIVWDDGRTAEVEVGTTDQVLGIADGRSFWWVVPTPDSRAGALVYLRSVQGEPEPVIAGVPVLPSRVDPAGGVLLELPDGWFGVVPQRAVVDQETGAATIVAPTVVPITSGRLLAISAEFAVVEECDERLVCARIVVDRGTSERSAIESGEYTGPVRYALAGVSSVAPGGRRAVVEVLDPADRASTQRSLGVVDLTNGAVDDIGPTEDVDQVAWTPDGRFVLFLAGGRVVAHDTESTLTVVVADELVAIDAFGVRRTGE